MSDVLMLYVFTRLDALREFGFILELVGGLACGFTIMFGLGEQEPIALTWGKRLIAVPVVGALLMLSVPTKSDMAIIVGGKIALDASRTETAKEVGQEVLDAIRAQLRKASGK